MRKSQIIARRSGLFLQFEFKLELLQNLLGYIAIFEDSKFSCNSNEKRVFILKKFLIYFYNSLYIFYCELIRERLL